MTLAHLDGVDINYEVVGDLGPWIALVSRGLEPLGDFSCLASNIAVQGYRVLIHDRRNCGQSSFDFDNVAAEEGVWADDLAASSPGAIALILLRRWHRLTNFLAHREPECFFRAVFNQFEITLRHSSNAIEYSGGLVDRGHLITHCH